MKWVQKGLALAIAACMMGSAVPAVSAVSGGTDAHTIVLSSSLKADGSYSHSATYDGAAVEEYDYVWHADPSEDHDEVKNSPAEFYTGTEPGDEAVYIAHDIYYYPELDADSFVLVNYDGDQEWAYYYTAEGYEDYIFSTLPASGSSLPTRMMHPEEEAYENAVLHITQAGTYIIEGQWHGQIWIDLGDTDDTFADESAKVTVILNGVDVTCTVAPALVFYSVYECDNTWEDQASWSAAADTTQAGANVILADGTVNNFTGENVYRILKTKYKDDEEQSKTGVKLQKKCLKQDGAFYSYVSMNIDGESAGTGVLNVTAGYEGMGSELHLSINGGNVNIYSQDDGINVNEDGVSVMSVNGGSLHILAGLGGEGDGIDSNGFLVINGGTVVAMANPGSDSGLDSDFGSYVNGGTVVALGSTMNWAEADDSNTAGQVTVNLQFSSSQSSDESIIITDTQGNVVFAYDPDKDEVAGSNARWYKGAVISCAELEVGESYFVYVGGDVYGTEAAGVYDVSTVTGFSDEAKQQCYTGTDVGLGRGGFGGGERPEGDMPKGEIPEGGFDMSNRPEGGLGRDQAGFDPALAEDIKGFNPSQIGGKGDFDPSQMDAPANFDPSQMTGRPDGMDQGGTAGAASIYFTMNDKVNGFSGVTDYDETAAIFTDVASGAWYEGAVRYAYENGLMSGISATSFNPTGLLNRGMVAQVLYNLEEQPSVSGTYFEDVDAGAWYADAVNWAAGQEIVAGYGNGQFCPENNITREQMAAILFNYAKFKGYDVTAADDLSAFTDGESTSSWARSAMEWAVGAGLLSGRDGGILDPTGTATRAEAAQILMNFCQGAAK